MRCKHLVLGVFVGSVALACDAKESDSAQASAKVDGAAGAKAAAEAGVKAQADASAAAVAEGDAQLDAEVAADADAEVAIEPRIGGTIVVACDYAVEILAFIDGRIEALVMDAKGELVADASAMKVAAKLAAEGDVTADVALAWDAPSARFVGQVEGDVTLVPGPVEVSVEAEGEASVGALAELGLAVQAQHGGQVMMAGAYSLEVVAQAGAVYVWAFDVAGKAHAEGDLDVELELESGAKAKLVWDPPSARYQAKIDGDVELEAKPIVVHVVADGKVAVAGVQSFHAAAAVAARGELDAAAEVQPPSVKAHADGGVHTGASAKGGAKAKTEGSAGASGKVSGKAGAKASGKAGAKIEAGFGGGAKAKAKAGLKIGG